MFGKNYIIVNSEDEVNTPNEGSLQFFLKNEETIDLGTVQVLWAKNSDGISARSISKVIEGADRSIVFNFNI